VKVVSAALSDIGRSRKQNEDYCVADPALHLYAVADGMGGYAAGEVASRAAIETLVQGVAPRRPEMEASDARGETWHVQGLLEQAVQEACAKVHALASERPEYQGMGTTLTAAWLSPRRAFIAHVGDSRAYLARGQEAHQLTEDHSLVKELQRQGRLTDEEARSFPYPNAVTRAIGPHPVVEVDTLDFELCPGDRILLCSDGLHRYLCDDKLGELLDQRPVEEVAASFIARANESGGADNITAVVVEICSLPEGDTEAERKVEIFRGMPLFRYLTYRELVQVLGATTMRHVRAGQTIFPEGSLGYELFVILAGRVTLRKAETVLAELGPGGHFGEMALVDQNRRSATAVATDDARMLVLPRRQFYQLLRKDPPLAVKLLWNFLQVLSGRLRQANEALSSMRVALPMDDTEDVTNAADLPERPRQP
jgi:serine/threonine protein phosphatase PrpC/CRP-like cAMP-binding protein